MKTLPIKIQDLEWAFEFLAEVDPDFVDIPVSSFLDLKTGAVHNPTSEEEVDVLFENDQVLELPKDLFKEIDGYRLMENFIPTVADKNIQERLSRAIEGKGAFRRFKDIVFHNADASLAKQWNFFETRHKRERIVNWLTSEGIQPEWDGDIFQQPVEESKRAAFQEVIDRFVGEVSGYKGVHRIALLGAMASDLSHPNDIVLMVAVDDTLDLTDVATQNRKLIGRANNAGANPGYLMIITRPIESGGQVLGTLCSYRECSPALRRACCEQVSGRQYLHATPRGGWDKEIQEQIDDPPVILWPSPAS